MTTSRVDGGESVEEPIAQLVDDSVIVEPLELAGRDKRLRQASRLTEAASVPSAEIAGGRRDPE